MSYDRKLPAIRVTLKKEDYNKLIELLSDVGEINIEQIKKKSSDLRDKSLKYARLVEDDNVLMRFYPSQIEMLVYILLFNSKQVKVSNNYYDVLVNNKEKYKKQHTEKNKGGN